MNTTMKAKLPTVKECIAHIESSGTWKYQYRGFSFESNRVYVFHNPTWGSKYFTTKELRHAFKFGW